MKKDLLKPPFESLKKPGTNFVACLLFVLFFVKINAQQNDIHFSQLTVEDGLSINNVTKILQDHKGFIWIATPNGLNRYDGYNFKTYLPDPSDSHSISDYTINSICEDKEGNIWAGTPNGLNRFDNKTEKFYRYKNEPGNPYSLSNDNVFTIFEDTSGCLWIGTLNGLNRYNAANNNFTVFKKISDRLNPDSLNSVLNIEQDYTGNLWLGTWNGMTCIKSDGTIVEQFFAQPADAKQFDYRSTSVIFEDNLKNLWIGSSGKGLKKYNPKTDQFTEFHSSPNNVNTLSSEYVTSIYQDRSNNIWIGTFFGLNLYNPEKEDFKRILSNPQISSSLISNGINTLYEDSNGLMWIGTRGGISTFNQPSNKFSFYRENENEPDKGLVSSSIITAYIDKNNNIWVGTIYGLDEILNKEKKIIHYKHDPNNPNSISSNFVRSIFIDHEGIVWIGTNSDGLNRYDPATGNFKLYTYDMNNLNSISNNGITAICEDANNKLWFGTWWGFNGFDRKSEKFVRFNANDSSSKGLKNDYIWDLYADEKGMVWIATNGGGVFKFNPADTTFQNFSDDAGNKQYISDKRVFTIFESKDGIMWFGTINGLNSYDRKTGQTTVYDKDSGLPGNLIDGIQEDNHGNIWISTDKGLSKFNRKENRFINYNKRNGLNDLEFLQNVAEKSSNGKLYFGLSGLMYFNPDSLKEEQIAPPVVFTDFKIYNQSVNISDNGILKEAIECIKSILIPPGNDVFTIDFALLDYFEPKKNTYRYKLDGFDIGWNYVGTRNSATYTNLPPGEYTFNVLASNNSSTKNEQETSIQIIIVPAFYQTWWFRILLAVGAFVLTLLFIRNRTAKITKQNRILENRVAERTKDLDRMINELSLEIIERKKAEDKVKVSLEEKEILLKEIHHRVKNNLQVISSILYLQSTNIKDKNIVNLFEDSQNRIKSMALIHEKLYQSKDFAEINFYEYTKGLADNLSQSYNTTEVSVQTKIDINDIKLSLDTAISCGLIINELITNSFKYAFPLEWVNFHAAGDEPLIEICVEKKGDDEYQLTVGDNGIGINKNLDVENLDSLGLKLVQSLVNQLNGKVEIFNERGTRYQIEFFDVT